MLLNRKRWLLSVMVLGALIVVIMLVARHFYGGPHAVGSARHLMRLDDTQIPVYMSYPEFREGETGELMVALGDLSRIPKPPKTLTLAVSGEGLSIDPLIYTVEDSELRSAIASNAPLNVAFRVQPISSGVKQLIVVVTTDSGGGQAFSLVADVRPSLNHVLGTVLQDGAIGIAVLATLVIWWQSVQRRNLAIEKRIDRAEDLAKAEPEKVKFAWDLARVKLEAYFDRNLSQVNQIFYVAVIVITVGFVFVLWGVLLSYGQPKITPTSLVAAVAGIISQFIGATFMLIYRSTMAQANAFMLVLERINTVGMAVQVIDVMPNDAEKNSVRADIAKLLLNANLTARSADDQK